VVVGTDPPEPPGELVGWLENGGRLVVLAGGPGALAPLAGLRPVVGTTGGLRVEDRECGLPRPSAVGFEPSRGTALAEYTPAGWKAAVEVRVGRGTLVYVNTGPLYRSLVGGRAAPIARVLRGVVAPP